MTSPIHPNIRLPTRNQLLSLADKHHLNLTEDEIDEILWLMEDTLDLYDQLEAIPDSHWETKYTNRESGYNPAADEDPYNAIARKCRVKGASSGQLKGYEVGLKDNITVRGVETSYGSNMMQEFIPKRDATIVSKLLDAGATITAKTNMASFASAGTGDFCDNGPVLNPHNTDYLGGGSSGGSAVAVVTEDVDIAIGGDQGGSLRIPASFNGCVGYKPTHGLVPYTGASSGTITLDTLGPMAQTVKDCARALNVIAGKDPSDPRQSKIETRDYLDGLNGNADEFTIGVLSEGFNRETTQSGINKNIRESLESFSNAGADIQEISVPYHEKSLAIWTAIWTEGVAEIISSEGIGYFHQGYYDTQFAHWFGTARRTQADLFTPMMKQTLLLGAYLAEEYHHYYYAKAQNLRDELRKAYDDQLSDVDVLALPTQNRTAFKRLEDPPLHKIIERGYVLGNTSAFNVTGHPAVSVPCGTVDGLPVGLMFVGKAFDDATLLAAAYAFEQNSI